MPSATDKLLLATVTAVSGTELTCTPDGSVGSVTAVDCCGAQVADRVVLEWHYTQLLAIAIVGGPHEPPAPTPAADYITEQHVAESSVEWNWCKWASGKAEAWKEYDLYVSGWTAWGSMYESNQYANSLAFPAGLFAVTPAPDVRLRYSDGGYALGGFENAGGGSASQSHNLYLLRPTSASATTWHLLIYYLGRWQ